MALWLSRPLGLMLAAASLAGLVALARITYGDSLRASSQSIGLGMPLTFLLTLLGFCGLSLGLWQIFRPVNAARS